MAKMAPPARTTTAAAAVSGRAPLPVPAAPLALVPPAPAFGTAFGEADADVPAVLDDGLALVDVEELVPLVAADGEDVLEPLVALVPLVPLAPLVSVEPEP